MISISDMCQTIRRQLLTLSHFFLKLQRPAVSIPFIAAIYNGAQEMDT